jgi:hypothetical protein
MVGLATLRLQAIPHALAARAQRNVGSRENLLRLGVLSEFGERVDNTADEADKDGRNTSESNRRIKEDQTTQRNGELVQSTNHGVGRGRGNTDGPCGGVRDEDRRETRHHHDKDDDIALVRGEVLLDVGRGPVLDEDGGDEQHRDGEQVVVVHSWKVLVWVTENAREPLTIKVLEVGKLNSLAHNQEKGGTADAVEQHPQVSSVQGRDGVGRRLCSMSHGAAESMLDICPGCDNGAENHQTEREEGHGGDGATEPQHLSVCDENDSQVLEDGVDGNREKLERPSARVDHADEEKGDGEPC